MHVTPILVVYQGARSGQCEHIAVSNGVLLVDEAATRYAELGDRWEAAIAAARSRFVPIVMTSLATVIGLLPTALALEAGTESNRPLALVVVGGLTSSTVLSLFLVPVMFTLLAGPRRHVEDAAAEQGSPHEPGGAIATPAVA